MRLVYLDNFRGFKKTIVPLRRVNFLVGENSTGKTSFLSLVNLMSKPEFFLKEPMFNADEILLGYFKDIVNINSEYKNSFEIGFFDERLKKEPQGINAFWMKFGEKNAKPNLVELSFIHGNVDVHARISGDSIKYTYKKIDSSFEEMTDQDRLKFFENWINKKDYPTGYKPLKEKYRGLPLLLNLSIEVSEEIRKKDNSVKEVAYMLPNVFGQNLTWLAPIRAKPKRIYEQFKDQHTPEGEHVPIMLKKLYGSQKADSAEPLVQALEKFGAESGLFEKIEIKDLGQDEAAPFELLVQLKQKKYSISNVGYGVAQVLPIIVEVLLASKNQWFSIQQPEVHLHPRAQAAFGEFVFNFFQKMRINFLIETHSDYIIDRFRSKYKGSDLSDEDSQVLFFQKNELGNEVKSIRIKKDGNYAENQPKEFREFFINEELRLLEI